MPGAAAQEGVPGPVHQARDLRRFGGYRERARVDAPDIQQVADQAAHVVGLLVDDAEELAHLGRVELRSGVQRGGGRTLDRGQRRAQLVAHHSRRHLAIERAIELFGAAYANVQPHSGTQANQAVFFVLLQPADRILSLDLAAGGPVPCPIFGNIDKRFGPVFFHGAAEFNGASRARATGVTRPSRCLHVHKRALIA